MGWSESILSFCEKTMFFHWFWCCQTEIREIISPVNLVHNMIYIGTSQYYEYYFYLLKCKCLSVSRAVCNMCVIVKVTGGAARCDGKCECCYYFLNKDIVLVNAFMQLLHFLSSCSAFVYARLAILKFVSHYLFH